MRKYDEYKDSGLDWLGVVPSTWQIVRAKDISNISRGAILRPVDEPSYFDTNGEWYYLNISDVKKGEKLLSKAKLKLSKLGSTKSARVSPGNLIITASATIGIPFINTVPVCVHDGFIPFKKNKIDVNFMFYYLSNSDIYTALGKNNTQKNIYLDEAKNITFTFPKEKHEQQAIANYLDAKTQAIDKKVALLEQKIETYKKLKRTLINQTITKGLRSLSEVEMKDSGVNYISKVPSNWKIERIKDLFKIGRGRVIGQLELIEDGKYPVYSSQTENNGCLGFIETYDFDGDLLTWTTDGANAGTVFRRSGKFNCTNVCGTLRPIRNNLDLNYMVYALQESAIHNKRIDTNGAKIMNNEMALIKVPLPPKSEQEEIAKYLDHKTTTIDAIVGNISKQIETLKQLRKTLINDVVTGKIKVVE